MSVANSPSLESDVHSSIEVLETHKEKQSSQSSPNPKIAKEKKSLNRKPKKQSTQNKPAKPTLKSILSKPVGELAPSSLNSLCNSIRHNRKGTSFSNLQILERILLELDHWENWQYFKGSNTESRTFLKPLHIFSMLTSLSKDIKDLKQKQLRSKNKRLSHNEPRHEKISAEDIQRLVKVVTLLSQQRHSTNLDPGCYTKDVPSFATMIAAEASRWETSAVDASLLFLDMVEKEEGEAGEWDPRLIGAVLDALARVGRAEDAQELLQRALGVDISNFDSESNKKAGASVVSTSTSSKHLIPSQAGPCYDALLRAWSKKALLLDQSSEPVNPVKKYKNAKKKSQSSNKMIVSALAQARHIILNHMPLQKELTITNRSCSAVLKGYSALGIGEESEKLLMALEALLLSPLYSKSSLKPSNLSAFPSSLDVACYNSVLHACSQSQDSNGVVSAERLFMSMKEQNPLDISIKNSTISHTCNEEQARPSSSFSVIPPQPDFVSYSSMLNCYSKHGMVVKAEALLNEMNDKNFSPNAACYLPVIQALELSTDSDAPHRVLSLIERSDLALPRPNRLLYTAALRCMRRHGCGKEAEIILNKFQNAYERGGPDVYSHILVLRAWEKTKPKADRHVAAQRAKIFLEEMEIKANASLLPRLDCNAYNIILNCYARAGEAENAEKLLLELEDGISSSSGDNTAIAQPNSKSYSLLIKALANSDKVDAIDRAWKILYRLGLPKEVKSTLPLQEPIPFNVSIENFNSMLRLFSKRGKASEAEALLNKMDELIVDGIIKQRGPDMQSYEAVLEALGRCGDADAPTRAEALVTRLEVMSEMGGDCQPSLLAYNILLNCFANAGMAGKAERLLERLDDADSYSFGSTIKAIANSGASQLVSISRSKSLAKTLGGTGNVVIFSHRLKLCAKWGLGNEAEQLIRQMEHTQQLNPGVIHYTAAINAWAKSTDDDALGRAEILFKTMQEKFDLDRAAYGAMLQNYSTRGNSKKARLLLQRILDSPDVKPNRASFTMVIDSYARSKSSNAGLKAEELLNQMRELHAAGNNEVEPDDITYASVIRCKQASKNEKIHDLSNFEKIELMRHLQIESWPFGNND
eukprot:CAMPEP_0172305578 /NCGR_PEP_ID=MMETSP1058-20130122/6831_1 /TAXON_ID=83371 /ORGANISM="Detonula confervacea, Strain CCMP 353" /LENGTH=1098 /DNA_ID=CAMNT_0013017207 /DNA_START=373 /DNA_END=3669 /DNA_ORIENTATION=+